MRVLVLYGTRPESIKLSPVVDALRRRAVEVTVVATGQHRMTGHPELRPDVDLGIMIEDQTLNGIAARVMASIDGVLAAERPDWLLVQGDTTSAAIGALAGFHRRVRIGHVEAGLRTGDLSAPFPEEMNRRLIDSIADLLFAPTESAHRNLIVEAVPGRVFVTGNPGIDSLMRMAEDMTVEPPTHEILVTVHRRESFGVPLGHIIGAVRESARRWPSFEFIVPVHPNPNVEIPVRAGLGGLDNVSLRAPIPYAELVRLIRRCYLVVTDSGGLQEEAPVFGRPVLVTRDVTERPEGIEAGVARLVGTDSGRIIDAIDSLLGDPAEYARMARPMMLYGDGRAGERIVDAIMASPRA